MTAKQPTARSAIARLLGLRNRAQAEFVSGYFKPGKGQYGEGDRFLGIRVPVLRTLVREFEGMPLVEAALLLQSPWHVARGATAGAAGAGAVV